MSTLSARPTEIKRIGKSAVQIVWSDGHCSIYPNAHLRNSCPCAECRERPPRLLPVVKTGGGDLYPLQIGLVGRYAVNIEWSDGHDSGIYSYPTLRGACPCPVCRPETPREEPVARGDDRRHP